MSGRDSPPAAEEEEGGAGEREQGMRCEGSGGAGGEDESMRRIDRIAGGEEDLVRPGAPWCDGMLRTHSATECYGHAGVRWWLSCRDVVMPAL